LSHCICLNWQFYDLTPAGREVCGIGSLNFCCSDAAYDFGANRRFPIPSGRDPGSIWSSVAELLVDFQEAAAGIARMELHDAEFRLIVL